MDTINLFSKFNHGIVLCPRVDGGGPALTVHLNPEKDVTEVVNKKEKKTKLKKAA